MIPYPRAWRIEDDPAWSIQALRAVSDKPCIQFDQLMAAGRTNPYCLRCDSCIAGQAIVLIGRQRELKE